MKLIITITLLVAVNKLLAQSFTEHVVDSFDSGGVFAGDLDGDGWVDIVATSRTSNIVNWYKNNGDGTFTTNLLTNKPGLGPRAVDIVDINNNGKLDVVLASDLDSTVYWFENDGVGDFTEHVGATGMSNANSIVATDMDNDTDIDLVISSYGLFGTSDLVSFLENNGSQNFTNINVLSQNSFILNAYPIHISSNTLKDIVVANTVEDQLLWFKQNANHTFTEQAAIAIGVDGITGLFAVNLDGDNDMDILTASQNDNKIIWHENINQSFVQHVISSSVDGAYAVYAADFDFDNDIDVVSAALDAGAVNVYINNGSQVFTSEILEGNTSDTASVFAIDINNDGSLDIISASSTGVRWHENHISDIVYRSGFE